MTKASLPLMILPAEATARIDGWDSTWGFLDLRFDARENLVVVAGSSRKFELHLPDRPEWTRHHYLAADPITMAGVWYRVELALHAMHQTARARNLAVRIEEFQAQVLAGWRAPSAEIPVPVLTVTRTADGPLWSAWWVNAEGAVPGIVHIVEDRQPLEFLHGAWPTKDLQDVLVTVVGVGSIGSAAADALGSYAVGHLALVDPDRLYQHNTVRHRLGLRDVGRFKATALAEALVARHPHLDVEPYVLDVIHDADVMRPLFARSDVILCAADGVAARRVTNHLARRAGVPLVLACALEHGAIGEVMRVQAHTACLLCHRANLVEAGGLDPEPALDRGYDDGPPHLPMTAVAGDLTLVADLAAKVLIGTVLEGHGHHGQRLPGDHAVIGLRPVPDMAEPFDVEQAGDVRWRALGPRRNDCPTCSRL